MERPREIEYESVNGVLDEHGNEGSYIDWEGYAKDSNRYIDFMLKTDRLGIDARRISAYKTYQLYVRENWFDPTKPHEFATLLSMHAGKMGHSSAQVAALLSQNFCEDNGAKKPLWGNMEELFQMPLWHSVAAALQFMYNEGRLNNTKPF